MRIRYDIVIVDFRRSALAFGVAAGDLNVAARRVVDADRLEPRGSGAQFGSTLINPIECKLSFQEYGMKPFFQKRLLCL